MRKEAITSVLAIFVFTIVCGLAYPLAVTSVSQLAFKHAANGSQVEQGGKVVGSELIAQPFDKTGPGAGENEPDERYFQPRPSQTDYSPAGTYFNNAGPNNKTTRDLIAGNVEAYLALESPHMGSLKRTRIPVDAVTGSASGVDPHISPANARIQANRISDVRGLPLDTVRGLIAQNTDGRSLGLFGEPGVNVLKLNIALDEVKR